MKNTEEIECPIQVLLLEKYLFAYTAIGNDYALSTPTMVTLVYVWMWKFSCLKNDVQKRASNGAQKVEVLLGLTVEQCN